MCLPCLLVLHHYRFPIPQDTYGTSMYISSNPSLVFSLNDSADWNKVNPLSYCSASMVYQAPGDNFLNQQRHVQFITWSDSESGMYQKYWCHSIVWVVNRLDVWCVMAVYAGSFTLGYFRVLTCFKYSVPDTLPFKVYYGWIFEYFFYRK